MKYCNECGAKLVLKECDGESELIPFCQDCGEYRFPTFSVAICTALFSADHKKILMMRQYGREKYNFLAGYVNKGETAEMALEREAMEEMGMPIKNARFLYTAYFEKSNTLMINFLTETECESLDGRAEKEVDEAKWFTFDEAYEAVIKGSLAERLLHYVKKEFK